MWKWSKKERYKKMIALYGFLTTLNLVLAALYGIVITMATTTTQLVCAIICCVCWTVCTILNGIMFVSRIRDWFKTRR
jgi:hypothetical protein